MALKQMKQEPSSIEEYQGRNNICFMMGEVLREGKTFYTTLKNRMCPLGCVATELDASLPKLSNEERTEKIKLPIAFGGPVGQWHYYFGIPGEMIKAEWEKKE